MGFYRALGRQREVQSTVNVKITVCVCVLEGGGGGCWGRSKMAKAMEDTVLSDRENKSSLAVDLLNQ